MARGTQAATFGSAIVAALLFTGSPMLGAEVVDALGRNVTVTKPPQRIVTIFSSNTELVAALGLADRIVGIETFTRHPPEIADRPKVGGRLGFSVDRIVATRPDLVVVTPARQAVHQLVAPMDRLGIPIIVFTHRDVAEVFANMRTLARIAGVEVRAEEVVGRLEARLAKVREIIAARSPPRVVMITGRAAAGQLIAVRAGSYSADAIHRAGGRLAFDDHRAMPQLSSEAILRADPDVILFAGSETDMRELFASPGWEATSAVRAGRVHAVPRAEFLIPGPRIVGGVERLARLLHPDAFAHAPH